MLPRQTGRAATSCIRVPAGNGGRRRGPRRVGASQAKRPGAMPWSSCLPPPPSIGCSSAPPLRSLHAHPPSPLVVGSLNPMTPPLAAALGPAGRGRSRAWAACRGSRRGSRPGRSSSCSPAPSCTRPDMAAGDQAATTPTHFSMRSEREKTPQHRKGTAAWRNASVGCPVPAHHVWCNEGSPDLRGDQGREAPSVERDGV